MNEMDYLDLKEHDYEVLEDDFDGLACPPLDLEALTIIETLSFDLSHFFDDIDVDEQTHGILSRRRRSRKISHNRNQYSLVKGRTWRQSSG
ncbi:hypothetical protein GBA52_007651 [Prunus armeniaca]|nr:hypothetical protein GBA52_007651 [Prunus armeniaca]